jgi:hypothetical protein
MPEMICNSLGGLIEKGQRGTPVYDILMNPLACQPLGGLRWDGDPMVDKTSGWTDKETTNCGDRTDLSGEGRFL